MPNWPSGKKRFVRYLAPGNLVPHTVPVLYHRKSLIVQLGLSILTATPLLEAPNFKGERENGGYYYFLGRSTKLGAPCNLRL